MAHCMKGADWLRRMGFGDINAGTVAKLLKGKVAKCNDTCRQIARIVRAKSGSDGNWHAHEVLLAYQLRRMDPADRARMDPKPPTPLPTKLPENLAQLNAFSEFLAQKTQSAPPR